MDILITLYLCGPFATHQELRDVLARAVGEVGLEVCETRPPRGGRIVRVYEEGDSVWYSGDSLVTRSAAQQGAARIFGVQWEELPDGAPDDRVFVFDVRAPSPDDAFIFDGMVREEGLEVDIVPPQYPEECREVAMAVLMNHAHHQSHEPPARATRVADGFYYCAPRPTFARPALDSLFVMLHDCVRYSVVPIEDDVGVDLVLSDGSVWMSEPITRGEWSEVRERLGELAQRLCVHDATLERL